MTKLQKCYIFDQPLFPLLQYVFIHTHVAETIKTHNVYSVLFEQFIPFQIDKYASAQCYNYNIIYFFYCIQIYIKHNVVQPKYPLHFGKWKWKWQNNILVNLLINTPIWTLNMYTRRRHQCIQGLHEINTMKKNTYNIQQTYPF